MTNLIQINNGQAVTSSRQVAEHFNKRHADVLEAVENIKTENSAVTQMFCETSYQAGTGKNYKEYLMNRDGFTLLAMGFTGKEALQWKLKYIQAFNEMEKQLLGQSDSLLLQAKAKNAQARLMNARRKDAEFLVSQINGLSSAAAELIKINAIEMITGKGFLPRPKTDAFYTAGDIAEEAGVSANKIGRIATAHNLKTDEYGITVLDKSASSCKQVPTFRYNEKGRQKLLQIVAVEN